MPQGIAIAGVAVLALVSAGLVALSLTQQKPTVVAATSAPVQAYGAPLDPVAVWVGDSFTEGSQVAEEERFVEIVSEHYGWRAVNFGEGGTGWLNRGPAEFPDRTTVPDRMRKVIAQQPNVVILAAGINDAARGDSDESLRNAMLSSIDQARSAQTSPTVYMVGPFWPDGSPTQDALRIRDLAASVAAERSVPFIDPIAQGWITGSRDNRVAGNRTEYIGADGTHPTSAGQAWIAQKLIENLDSLGVLPAQPAA